MTPTLLPGGGESSSSASGSDQQRQRQVHQAAAAAATTTRKKLMIRLLTIITFTTIFQPSLRLLASSRIISRPMLSDKLSNATPSASHPSTSLPSDREEGVALHSSVYIVGGLGGSGTRLFGLWLSLTNLLAHPGTTNKAFDLDYRVCPDPKKVMVGNSGTIKSLPSGEANCLAQLDEANNGTKQYGLKQPATMFLVPDLYTFFGTRLCFIHCVTDPLKFIFSHNQQFVQLLHPEVFHNSNSSQSPADPKHSYSRDPDVLLLQAQLWNANVELYEYAMIHFPNRYIVVQTDGPRPFSKSKEVLDKCPLASGVPKDFANTWNVLSTQSLGSKTSLKEKDEWDGLLNNSSFMAKACTIVKKGRAIFGYSAEHPNVPGGCT